MEENVALDSSKQKDFVKSVKGLKKLIKKQKEKGKEPIKNESKSVKDGKIKKRRSRGLVYLSHIPHGFYENEMSQYFRQFGLVTNVRVIRSPRTGNSKGYGFVEFKDTTVAQVVAETMNNYLMGKRLIKAVYIPPNEQKTHAKRKHWNFENNPTALRRQKQKKDINAPKSQEKDLQAARNMLKNLTKTKKKLKEIGIDYDFFKPVDIPEGISYNSDSGDTTKDIKEVNIKKEDSKNTVDKKKVKVTMDKKSNLEIKNDDVKAKKQKGDIQNKKGEKVKTVEKKDVKKVTTQLKNDEIQKSKKQKLKESNVKPLEDYIGIEESDGDSDGSLEFDSEEFEKSIDGEDSFGSEDDDSSEDDSDETADDEKPAQILNPKKNQKVIKKIPQQQTALKKVDKKDKQQAKTVVAPKRKADQKAIPPKKVKFEKQNNKKTINKVIKKKK